MMLAAGIVAAYAGISVEEFEAKSDAFLRSAQHPTLGRSYMESSYAPMVEQLAYLAANGFSNDAGIRPTRGQGFPHLPVLHDNEDGEIDCVFGADQALERAAKGDWTVVSFKTTGQGLLEAVPGMP